MTEINSSAIKLFFFNFVANGLKVKSSSEFMIRQQGASDVEGHLQGQSAY